MSMLFPRRPRATALLRTLGLLAAAAVAFALFMSVGPESSFTIETQQFGKNGATTGSGTGDVTYAMTPGMLRMDARTSGSGPQGSFSMIVRFEQGKVDTIVLEPQQKKYAETSESTQSYLTDPDNIESIFAEPSSSQGVCHDPSVTSCRKVGTASVLGRRVEEWKVAMKAKDGSPANGTLWYDPVLHFVVQAKNDDGSGFVPKKIAVGKAAASRFQIPPGYTKF